MKVVKVQEVDDPKTPFATYATVCAADVAETVSGVACSSETLCLPAPLERSAGRAAWEVCVGSDLRGGGWSVHFFGVESQRLGL